MMGQQQPGAYFARLSADFEALRQLTRLAARLPHEPGSSRKKRRFVEMAKGRGWRCVLEPTCVWLLRQNLDAVFSWDGRRYVLEQVSLPPEDGCVHISLGQSMMFMPPAGACDGPTFRMPRLGDAALVRYPFPLPPGVLPPDPKVGALYAHCRDLLL